MEATTWFSIYILIGTWHEERGLVRVPVECYRDYQRAAPKLLPWVWRVGQGTWFP